MEIQTTLRKSATLRGYAFSRDDLIALNDLLQQQATVAGAMQVANYVTQDNQTPEQLEQEKESIRSLFSVFVNIETGEGRTISQGNKQLLLSPDLPNNISRVEFNSAITFREVIKSEPKNQVYVLLDFRKYHATGQGFQPAEATPNESQYIVSGENNWVRATQSKIEDFLSARKRRGTWMHGQGIYDILLQVIGIVFIAWIMSLAIPRIDAWFVEADPTYRYAGYIFTFILGLRLFMFMFSYARWIWPVVELRGDNSVAKGHRLIWISLFLSIIGGLIYDLLLQAG